MSDMDEMIEFLSMTEAQRQAAVEAIKAVMS